MAPWVGLVTLEAVLKPQWGWSSHCLPAPPGERRRAQLGVREPVQPRAAGHGPRDPRRGRAGNAGGRQRLESRIWAEPPPWGCAGDTQWG